MSVNVEKKTNIRFDSAVACVQRRGPLVTTWNGSGYKLSHSSRVNDSEGATIRMGTEPSHVIQVIMDSTAQTDPRACDMAEGLLKKAEMAP